MIGHTRKIKFCPLMHFNWENQHCQTKTSSDLKDLLWLMHFQRVLLSFLRPDFPKCLSPIKLLIWEIFQIWVLVISDFILVEHEARRFILLCAAGVEEFIFVSLSSCFLQQLCLYPLTIQPQIPVNPRTTSALFSLNTQTSFLALPCTHFRSSRQETCQRN